MKCIYGESCTGIETCVNLAMHFEKDHLSQTSAILMMQTTNATSVLTHSISHHVYDFGGPEPDV